MKDFLIFTGATCDVTPEIADFCGIDLVLPLPYSIDGVEYTHYPDYREYSIENFYADLRAKRLAQTAAPSIINIMDALEPVLQTGKKVLYLGFSTGLSNTYQNVCLAKEELDKKYPDQLYLVDDKMASMGEALFAYYCSKMREEGKTIEEVYAWAESNALNITAQFTVDDLFHLKRGGRVSATTALVGSALGIKPILHVNDEGRLINIDKTRGRKASLDKIIENTLALRGEIANEKIFISHGDCIDDAKYVKEELKKKTKLKDEDFAISHLGPVIATHAGPGTVAIFVYGTHR